MSASPTPASSSSSSSTLKEIRSKKLVVPKVWKRPHSTIYGKNVEFGSSLYSDKIGEINGRKFNSELPWTMRNSGSSSATSSAGALSNQGYLSNVLVAQPSRRSQQLLSDAGSMSSYVDLLESTNPNRTSKRYNNNSNNGGGGSRKFGALAEDKKKRIDFYDQYMDFSREIDHLHATSLLMSEPMLTRKMFDHFLAFDYDLGLFVPNYQSTASTSSGSFNSCRSLLLSPSSSSDSEQQPPHRHHYHHDNNSLDINNSLCSYVPLPTMTQQTQLLPKHKCQLMSSPYGQSNDGRKLSLSAINPQSYRPSLPQRTSTTHASDGEEFEFHDRSSPFYTDR